MPRSLRYFIGMILLLVLVIVYALVAVTIATYRLAESPWYIHLAFFAASGLFWVVPGMAIISWMVGKPKREKI